LARTDRVIQWLLDGDPAIRWQALRDLAGALERAVERERRKVARDGWGGRLLARQDPEGTWAGGLYSPKWISTTYTMLMLRDFGLPAINRQARRACTLLLDGGLQPDGGVAYGTWANEHDWTGWRSAEQAGNLQAHDRRHRLALGQNAMKCDHLDRCRERTTWGV